MCVCMYVCVSGLLAKGARVAFNNPYLTRVQGGLGVSHASMRFRVYPLEGVKMGGGKPLMETRAVSRAWVCMQRKAPGEFVNRLFLPVQSPVRSGQKVPKMTADPRDDQGTKRGRL